MILSDGSLKLLLGMGHRKGGIQVLPDPEDWQRQPASVDVTLSNLFLLTDDCVKVVDPYALPEGLMIPHTVLAGDTLSLAPGEFVLGCTEQKLKLPDNVAARVEGKSSLGRLGLLVHATAGFVDPGWQLAQITLELSNVAPWAILLHPGMGIAQLTFEHLDSHAERPYGHADLRSRYAGQVGPVASRSDAKREESKNG